MHAGIGIRDPGGNLIWLVPPSAVYRLALMAFEFGNYIQGKSAIGRRVPGEQRARYVEHLEIVYRNTVEHPVGLPYPRFATSNAELYPALRLLGEGGGEHRAKEERHVTTRLPARRRPHLVATFERQESH